MLRCLALIVLLTPPSAVFALTLTVNSLGDLGASNAGDGQCWTGNLIDLGEGVIESECTLRAALEEANQAGGTHVTINLSPLIETDVNGFSIISIGSGLPFITNPVTIAGDTHPNHEPGTRQTPLAVNWVGSADNVSGIRFSSSGTASYSAVRNIAVTNFPNSGILISGGTGYLIQGNNLGSRWLPSGTALLTDGNGGHGIDINGGSSMPDPTTIMDNLIDQNGGNGINLRGGSATTFIIGNIIGLLPAIGPGSTGDPFRPERGNSGAGIFIEESAGGSNQIGTVGGNTISNNGGGGIVVRANLQVISGNLIGLPHDFQVHPNDDPTEFGNDSSGLILESSNNTVGASNGGNGNFIGNAGSVGIRIGNGSASTPYEADGNLIRLNVIGTDSDNADYGQSQGIRIDNGSDNEIDNNTIAFNTTGIEIRSGGNFITRNQVRDNSLNGIWARQPVQIGSLSASDANIIGNNGRGIRVTQALGGVDGLVQIINNYIGTNADGDDLGNTTGVQLEGDNLVWLGFAGNGNVIGNSSGSAVWLTNGATNKQIQSNRIGVHPNNQPIGNLRGVRISGNGSSGNIIGYELQNIDPNTWFPGSGLGNIIAHSAQAGVDMTSADEDSIENIVRGNQFYGNNGTGIDLGMSEPDPGGGSTGPNLLMNFPEFDADYTWFDHETGQLHFRYRVRTFTHNAAYDLTIDFYAADGNSSEGLTFLGSELYQSGEAAAWKTGILNTPGIGHGWIIATATDQDGNTGQFTINGVQVGSDQIFNDRFE